jgi:hypothetical protein
MRASRMLPSAAFAVAVGFFFVPPVLSVAGLMPAAARPQPRLEVIPGDTSAALAPRAARHTAMLQPRACAPAALPAGETKALGARSVVAMADPLH